MICRSIVALAVIACHRPDREATACGRTHIHTNLFRSSSSISHFVLKSFPIAIAMPNQQHQQKKKHTHTYQQNTYGFMRLTIHKYNNNALYIDINHRYGICYYVYVYSLHIYDMFLLSKVNEKPNSLCFSGRMFLDSIQNVSYTSRRYEWIFQQLVSIFDFLIFYIFIQPIVLSIHKVEPKMKCAFLVFPIFKNRQNMNR